MFFTNFGGTMSDIQLETGKTEKIIKISFYGLWLN